MESERTSPGEVTRLLRRLDEGDGQAADRLFALVYDELRRLARAQVRRAGSPPTLSATALVHESYLKLSGGSVLHAENRSHFLSIAARAMRQVLVDQARQKRTTKRGGEWTPTTLMDGHSAFQVDFMDMLALDEALERLESRQRQIVEARFFGGLEEAEIARSLGISDRTVRREWVKARAWLVRSLFPQIEDAPPAH